jgi:transposase
MSARWAKVDPAFKARGHAGKPSTASTMVPVQRTQKHHVVANVAIARELAGWCWSLASLQ